jgi:membrane carboxypeptidase/penicillin-binding protein PbpC
MLSIGVTPKFTVAIWFGNFSRKFGVGSFDRKKSGLKVAVPAMMEMFDSLKPKNWFKKPQKVLMKEICEDAIIIGECKQIENDLVIKGVNLVRPCRYFSPQILIKLINDGKIPKFSALKDHNCFDTWRRYEPLIEGLSDGKTYIKNRVFPKSMKLTALKCYSFDDNQTIFWFIDNNKTLTSKSGEKIFHYLPPGKHTVKCIDAQSREKRVEIKLREL